VLAKKLNTNIKMAALTKAQTTALLAAGVRIDQLTVLGGWNSDAGQILADAKADAAAAAARVAELEKFAHIQVGMKVTYVPDVPFWFGTSNGIVATVYLEQQLACVKGSCGNEWIIALNKLSVVPADWSEGGPTKKRARR
jgi:hypothetical protein